MIKIRMLATNKIRAVSPNVAFDLVERGLATRDLRVRRKKAKPKPFKVEKKAKKNLSYKNRMMNSSDKTHKRKTP